MTERQSLVKIIRAFNRRVARNKRCALQFYTDSHIIDWRDRIDIDTGSGQCIMMRFNEKGELTEFEHHEWM